MKGNTLRRVTAGLVKYAAWLVGAAALIGLPLFLLAPHSELARTAWVHYGGFFLRPVRFPALASHRHKLCSLSDAWSQAVMTDKILAEQKVSHTFRQRRADGDLVQIDTSMGPFWIDSRDLATLPEMIAEEQRRGQRGASWPSS